MRVEPDFKADLLSSSETPTSCTREIVVEVPPEEVTREMAAVVEKIQKLARIPGFRKGKAPASIIRQRFADDVKSEVVDALVPKYFRQEVERQGLVPVSRPQVTDLELGDGEPLRFKASFEVLPEIEVAGYEELRAEKKDVTVTDEEVAQALEEVREQHASYTPVEGRALADGDYAQVAFRGQPKDGVGKPVKMDEVLVEIGGANTVREFSENLRGAQAGEERTFDVVYAEDFSDARLAGKTLTYSATVHGIKQKSLPALDDALAREAGEFQTLEELRGRVRQQLEAQRRHSAEHEAKERLVEELVRRNDFPVPESLVERQIDLRLERGLRALAAQGMRTEEMKKMDFARLRAGQREGAMREVKASLLLDKIAQRENIAVSDAELDREIELLAAQSRQTVEALRARLTGEGSLDRIRDRIRSEKTLDLLYQRSA
ncbi:MAG: trigger factor [Terriglobales bacterium]